MQLCGSGTLYLSCKEMKRLNLVFVLILLPIYQFITWISIFNELEFASQAERVAAWQEKYFFGLSFDPRLVTYFMLVLLCSAFYHLLKVRKLRIFFKVSLTAIISFLLLINAWSLL